MRSEVVTSGRPHHPVIWTTGIGGNGGDLQWASEGAMRPFMSVIDYEEDMCQLM